MKAKFFIIALLAMILFDVEGYAQRERGGRHGGGREEARIERQRRRSVTRRTSPGARSRHP